MAALALLNLVRHPSARPAYPSCRAGFPSIPALPRPGAKPRRLRRSVPPHHSGAVHWFEVAPCFIQHVINARNVDDGTGAAPSRIVLDAIRYPWFLRLAPGGDAFDANPPGQPWRYTFDLVRGTVQEAPLLEASLELPRLDEMRGIVRVDVRRDRCRAAGHGPSAGADSGRLSRRLAAARGMSDGPDHRPGLEAGGVGAAPRGSTTVRAASDAGPACPRDRRPADPAARRRRARSAAMQAPGARACESMPLSRDWPAARSAQSC